MTAHDQLLQELKASVSRLTYFLSGGAATAIGVTIAAERGSEFTSHHLLWVSSIALWAMSIAFGVLGRRFFHNGLFQNWAMLTAPKNIVAGDPYLAGAEHLLAKEFEKKAARANRTMNICDNLQQALVAFGGILYFLFAIIQMPNNPLG